MSEIQFPIIIVNFKTYSEATGGRAIRIANICDKISQQLNVQVGVVPQPSDIPAIAKSVEIPVFAQHIDPIKPGSNTGSILAEAIRDAGAVGTLINHSEKQLKLSDIDKAIRIARENNLISCVCTSNPRISGAVASLKPNIIAIEPPELVGSGIPVSKAKPDVVTGTVRLVRTINKEVPILCGAGISQGEDVKEALRLGTEGVLVASGIIKAKDPYLTLYEFAKATK